MSIFIPTQEDFFSYELSDNLSDFVAKSLAICELFEVFLIFWNYTNWS